MALDIYVSVGETASRHRHPNTPYAALEDDGYYWLLDPVFKTLAEVTGQSIDLYDGAALAGKALDVFSEAIASAKDSLSGKPDVLDVHDGSQRYFTVNRVMVEALMDKLSEIASTAKRLEARVMFVGD